MQDQKQAQDFSRAYSNQYNDLLLRARENTVKTQYGIGGAVLWRGYYCPSPVIEIVITNVKKGRLSNKPVNNADFMYCFNKENNLCMVDFLHLKQQEFIIDNGNSQFSLLMSSMDGIVFICKIIYDSSGKILSFLVCSPNEKHGLLNKEEYSYENNLVSEMRMFQLVYGKTNFMTHNKFVFQHDDKGFITSYLTEELKNDQYWGWGNYLKPRVKKKV